MNEDLKPLYDIESCWEIVRSVDHIDVFEHKDYRDLVRVIDFNNQTIHFVDRKRIHPVGIIDINKKLPALRKVRIMTLISRVINAEKPISLPYSPEKLKVYIEDKGKYLGILYYMDYEPEKHLVQVKRYFKVTDSDKKGLLFEEVPFDEYYKYEEESNEQTANESSGTDT